MDIEDEQMGEWKFGGVTWDLELPQRNWLCSGIAGGTRIQNGIGTFSTTMIMKHGQCQIRVLYCIWDQRTKGVITMETKRDVLVTWKGRGALIRNGEARIRAEGSEDLLTKAEAIPLLACNLVEITQRPVPKIRRGAKVQGRKRRKGIDDGKRGNVN